MRKFVPVFVLLAVTVSLGHSAEQATATRPSKPSKPTYAERYSVIAECNIFLRQRSRSSSGGNRGGSASTQPSDARSTKRIALLGVTVDGEERRAFFESSERSGILRLGVGDAVGDGKIVRIELDGVEFQVGQVTRRVGLGQDLSGGVFVPSAATSDNASGAPASEAGLSLEERMKLRRQRESQGQR